MSFLTNKTRTVVSQPVVMQAEGAPSTPAFQPQIVRSVRLRPRLAIGVAAAVLILAGGYGATRKPVYTATALVYEEPAAAKVMSDGVTSGVFDANGYDTYLQQQMQLIARADVLQAALAKLPQSQWLPLGPTLDIAAADLATQLKIARVTTSYQVSISLQMADPKAAAAVVNAVAASYLDEVKQQNIIQADQRAQLLAEERRRIEREMESTRAEQAGLSSSLGVASTVGETSNPYDFEIASVRQQLLMARQAHDVSSAQLASLIGGGARTTALAAAADELIGGDAGLASMRASIGARRSALTGQMAGMKPDNPVYRQDLDELNDLDKTLDTMTTQLRGKAERQLQEKLRTDLERTADVEGRLNAQLAQLTAKATSAAPKLQRASELAGDLQRLTTRYATVDDALRSLQLEANGPGMVRLSLAASVPQTADPSKRLMLLMASPLLALICGITVAVLARKRDRRLYGARDMEDVVGFPPIAILPARADVSARVLDEYVLRLAAGIEGAYRSSGAQTFLLTAVSAKTEIRTLRKALTEKLERIGLDVAVARTTDLLLAGPELSDESRQELATAGETDGFVALHLAKLRSAHSLVLIDAPALGTSAETEYVARCADATVLIAECGVTTREELKQAAQLLERLNAKGVGTVLTELGLRYADANFREAIDAFERRQPESAYASTQRDVVYPASKRTVPAAEPVVAELAVEPEPVVSRVAEPVATAEPEPVVEHIAQPIAAPIAEPIAEPVVEPALAAAMIADDPVADTKVEDVSEPHEVYEATEDTAQPEPEPMIFRRNIHEMPHIRKVDVVTRVSGATALAPVEYELRDRDLPSHEKIAPKLSALRKQTPDGDTPMSKSWFSRFLRRDEEKVSIIPEGDDDDEPIDQAAFLESRISRSVKAYDLPLVKEEEAAPVAKPEDSSFSRRFVLESLHEPESAEAPVEWNQAAWTDVKREEPAVEVAEHRAEVAPAMAQTDLSHFREDYFDEEPSAEFKIPQELMAPWSAKPVLPPTPEEVIAQPVVAEHVHAAEETVLAQPAVAPEPEFVAVSKPEPVVVEEPLPVAHAEPELVAIAEPEPESAPAVRVRPARPMTFHELAGETEAASAPVAVEPPARYEPVEVEPQTAHPIEPEIQAAVPEVPEEVAAVAEPVVEEPVVLHESAAKTDVVHKAAPAPARDPYAPPATRDPYAPPAGTSRWDPIPPLRPSDSGWDRIHAANGFAPMPAPGAPVQHEEDWHWTSRANEVRDEFEAQHWDNPESAEEAEEPILSRPWGLLSRFQQTNQIAPPRKPLQGASTEKARPGPFDPGSKS
jgi:uncharacterized protein involved in exopolysaccharide biosynthesis